MGKVFKCDVCGKTVRVIHEGEGEIACCGQQMNPSDKFSSLEEILDFAIKKEEAAHQFYADWVGWLEELTTRQIFEELAGDELKHRANLMEIKHGRLERLLESTSQKVMDLRISDYLANVTLRPDLEYQEALVVAMKREKASFRLYTDLAATIDDESLRTVFLVLAQEEAKHKLRLEIEYDEQILTEN